MVLVEFAMLYQLRLVNALENRPLGEHARKNDGSLQSAEILYIL